VTAEIGAPEIEGGFLGALLHLAAQDAGEELGHVTADYFIGPTHRLLYAAIAELVDAGVDPTPYAVLGQLRRTGEARPWVHDAACGAHLAALYGDAPPCRQARWLAGLLRDHLIRRRAQAAGVRLTDAAGTASIEALLALVEREATDIMALTQPL